MKQRKYLMSVLGFLLFLGLVYAQMPGTTPFSFFKKNAPDITCTAGVIVGNYCWYLSNTSESCDQACTTYGGCNLTGTRDYAGSNGTSANCEAVAVALGSPAGTPTEGPASMAVGCNSRTSTDVRRNTDTTTTCAATASPHERFCACNI